MRRPPFYVTVPIDYDQRNLPNGFRYDSHGDGASWKYESHAIAAVFGNADEKMKQKAELKQPRERVSYEGAGVPSFSVMSLDIRPTYVICNYVVDYVMI